MFLLAKVGLGFMGAAAVGGAMISSEGFIHVKVHEKQANGTNVSPVSYTHLDVYKRQVKLLPHAHITRSSL